MEIGEKIRHLRRSKDLTQHQMSELTNIPRSTISNYEVGRRTPHLKDLQNIGDFFGVGIEYFGVTARDEVFDLLARAKEVFQSKEVETNTKEELYREFMRLYLTVKDDEK